MEAVTVFLAEAIHIQLGEIQALVVQIAEKLVEEALAELLVEGNPGKMIVLQGDGHLLADLIEIGLLGTGSTGRRGDGDGCSHSTKRGADHGEIAGG